MKQQRHKFSDPHLKSYLTDRRYKRTGMLHPENREILLGACKTIAIIAGLLLIVTLIFTGAGFAEFQHGAH